MDKQGTSGIGGIPSQGYPQIVEVPLVDSGSAPEGFLDPIRGECSVCRESVWMASAHVKLLGDARYLVLCSKCAAEKREQQSRG